MARAFDGNDDVIRVSPGALAGTTLGNFTSVMVMRRGANTAWHSLLMSHNSGGSLVARILGINDSNGLYISSGDFDSNAPLIQVSDGWCLVAASKATGSNAPRYHKYRYDTDAWTHANGGTAFADGTAVPSDGHIQIGTVEGIFDDFNGDIAAAACFSSVLTDAQIESLAHSLHAWHIMSPTAMWVLDQSFLTSGGTSAPTASGAVTGNSAGNTTSYAAPIPDNLAAGDRVIIGVVKDGTGTITWPGSPAWLTLTNGAQTSDSHHMEIRYRDIDGTEGWSGTGNTITVTGASEGYASYAVKVAAGTYDTATAPASDGTFTSANSTTPDPPSVTPSWGALSTLWIVLYGWDGNVAHSAYPTNYSSNQVTDRWANTGGSGIAGATREATVSPENPGTASIASGEEWAAFTVGIKPISTIHVVNDLTGGGADQTAITGTAVSTNSAPIGYGHEVVAPHSVPAGGAVTGAGLSAFTFGSTAAGVPTTPGTAAAALSFTGAASGTPETFGTATGAYSFTGSASGSTQATVTGTGLGAFSFDATASGAPETFGTAAATLSFTGAAAGNPGVQGAGSTAVTFTGTAAGTPDVQGQAVGAFTFTGTAAGIVEGVATGTGLGEYTFTATAAGTPDVHGTAAAALTFDAAATGVRDRQGQGVATLTFTGAALGAPVLSGQAAAAFTFTGAAVGNIPGQFPDPYPMALAYNRTTGLVYNQTGTLAFQEAT